MIAEQKQKSKGGEILLLLVCLLRGPTTINWQANASHL